MKQHATLFTTVLAVAGSLIITGSAQAQYVTGDPTLDNLTMNGGPMEAFSTTGAGGITTTTPTAPGYLYGSADIALANQQTFNPADNEVIWTYTINSPTPGTTGPDYANPAWTWSGITILLAANGGSDERYPSSGYDGYNLTYSPFNGQNIANTDKGYSYNPATQTVTQVAPLDAVTIAGIASGTITTVQFSVDPSTMPDGYSMTWDSIQLVVAPEPSTLALVGLGLGVAGLLIARRRQAKVS
jgi:PEP-CTERM motif